MNFDSCIHDGYLMAVFKSRNTENHWGNLGLERDG